MKKTILALLSLLCFSFAVLAASTASAAPSSVHDFKVKNIDGQMTDLSKYKGQVLLIVNTASQCGFTPQYEGLEKLYNSYKDKNFVILGFPSNDFGGQEPGSDTEIKKFCTLKYKVTFPMYSKLKVKDPEPGSLYEYLQKTTGRNVQWNFGKFLVAKDGHVIQYFSSNTTPSSDKLVSAIEDAMK